MEETLDGPPRGPRALLARAPLARALALAALLQVLGQAVGGNLREIAPATDEKETRHPGWGPSRRVVTTAPTT